MAKSKQPQRQLQSAMPSTATPLLSRTQAATQLLACGVGIFFTVGILLIYGFSVFIKPIAESTGWPRVAVASAVAPVAIVSGLMSPLVGAFADRFGPRLILLISSMTMGAGILGIAFCSADLASFLLAFTVASILGGAQTGVPYTHVIVGWFQAKRGMYLGFIYAFAGLGIATVPFILAAAIDAWGWRSAMAAAGLASMAVLFPLALFVIRDPPHRAPGVRSGGNEGMPLMRALATPEFWVLLVAFLLNSCVAAAGSISLPLILADRGASAEKSAVVMSVVGGTLIAVRLGFGALLDRLSPIGLTSLAFFAPVLGHLTLACTSGTTAVYLSALLFGLATGAEGDAIGYLLARSFGIRSFGKLYGINYLAFTLGSGAGPALLIATSNTSAGYTGAFIAAAIAGGIAPALMLSQWRRATSSTGWLGRYRTFGGHS